MIVTSTQFQVALKELLSSPSKRVQNGIKMLIAHYQARGRVITAEGLAKSVGYSNYHTGNEQYGRFAHTISELVGYTPEQIKNGQPIWTYTICTAAESDSADGHFQWELKKEMCEAMEQLGLVSPFIEYHALDDLAMRQLELESLSEKHRQTVALARIGQGQFRDQLIKFWQTCAVTGLANTDFLVASHIKPWRDCTTSEAIDMTNGLLLAPNLDKAFDKGYISFGSDGKILISPQLSSLDVLTLGINEEMKLRKCLSQHGHFLEYHRSKVFRKNQS